MSLKKSHRYHFANHQSHFVRNILKKKSPKQKLKEVVFLFFLIIFLWIPFSISAAISDASLRMEVKDLWEKTSIVTGNIAKNISYQRKSQTIAAVKEQNIGQKKQPKKSLGTAPPTFLPFGGKIAAKKSIENAENSSQRVKLSEIAELTNEKGQKVNEKLENPLLQQKEDLPKMAFEHFWHKVKNNESLWYIAQMYGISVESIITANHLSKAEIHTLPRNKNLKIPPFSGIYHQIKNGDNLLKLSQKYNVSLKEIRKYNKIPNFLTIEKTIFLPQATFDEKKRQSLFGSIFSPPMKDGQIVSHYGLKFHPIKKKNIFHTGIDIKKGDSNKVFCIADGRVIKVIHQKNQHKHVIIQHKHQYTSSYAHLSAVRIQPQQSIKRGELIGFVGRDKNTAKNNHYLLHFALKKNDQYINPKRFFHLK